MIDRRVSMIVAMTRRGVIGRDGGIPWRYRLDLMRFQRLTLGSTVIMGRKTWESIGRPLKDRRNVVVTSKSSMVGPKVESFGSLTDALDASEGDVWLIGGAGIYDDALYRVVPDIVDVTIVPDVISTAGSVVISLPDPISYECTGQFMHDDDRLTVFRYVRYI